MLWMFIAVTRLYPFLPTALFPTKKPKKTPHSFDLVESWVYCNGLLLLRIVFCRLVYLPSRFGRWGRRLNFCQTIPLHPSLPPFFPLASPFPSSLPPRRLDSSIGTCPSVHTSVHASTIHKTSHPSTHQLQVSANVRVRLSSRITIDRSVCNIKESPEFAVTQ